MMGFSYNSDHGPVKCFNAAKNWQLGWYEKQKESYNPIAYQNIGKSTTFIMNGVEEYKTDASEFNTNGELIMLRLEYEFNGNNDYYIGYNRARYVKCNNLKNDATIVL
jgi:hypothetical protein